MSKPDVASDAQKTASDVSKNAGSDAKGAYSKLVTEVTAEEQRLGGPNSQQYKDYISNLNKDLKQAGVLPELSLAWASDSHNNLALANASQDGGKITKDGINNYLNAANPGEFGSTGVDAANAMFANQLKSMYDQVAKTQDGNGKSTIGGSDLNNSLQTQKELVSQGGFIKDFLGNKNAPTALFDLLDTAQHGGNPDGWIGQGDVTAFLNNKDHNTELKAMGYTDAQIKNIDSGLKNWSDHWNDPSMKLMQKDGKIGRTQLANAFGYGNIEGLSNAVQNNTFDQVPPAPTDSNPNPTSSSGNPSARQTEAQITAEAKQGLDQSLIDSSLVHGGDGYQTVAKAILPQGASETEIVKLGNELQKLNNNGDVIYANAHLLNQQKIDALLKEDPVLSNYYNTVLQESIGNIARAQAHAQ